MRKVEVEFRNGVGYLVEGRYFSSTECEAIFGEVPGETRSYYIIPAGDVVEFEIECQNGFYDFADNSGDFPCGILEGNGIVFEDGETRRVTAIVHPPDEPTEETVEAIPAKQPILLKRNNTPTREGNYSRGLRNPDVAHATKVVNHFMDGTLGFYDSSGVWNEVGACEWWSDELGPIEFESEPEPPPKPKCGWFEHKGERHTVCELEDDDIPQQPYVVTPPVCTREYGLSRWQSPESLESEGIKITWYGEEA